MQCIDLNIYALLFGIFYFRKPGIRNVQNYQNTWMPSIQPSSNILYEIYKVNIFRRYSYNILRELFGYFPNNFMDFSILVYPSAGHFVINLDFFFMHTVHRKHITFLWQNTSNSWWSLERAFNAFNSVRNIVYAENLFDRFSKLVHRHRMIWFISNWALDHFIRIFVCITHQLSFFFQN